MSYWDTSALVKLYAKEPDSSVFEHHALLPGGFIVTSQISLYEARATFRRKEFEGTLQARAAATLYGKLLQDVASGQIRLVEFSASVEREYAQLLETCYGNVPAIPLRTLAALHLASACALSETELVATDQRLRDAAKLLKLALFPA